MRHLTVYADECVPLREGGVSGAVTSDVPAAPKLSLIEELFLYVVLLMCDRLIFTSTLFAFHGEHNERASHYWQGSGDARTRHPV
jgi:hypothetical protein